MGAEVVKKDMNVVRIQVKEIIDQYNDAVQKINEACQRKLKEITKTKVHEIV